MMYIRFPLSLQNNEDLLFERGVNVWHETARMVEPVSADIG